MASRNDAASIASRTRAEELLTSYLLPCQLEDWKKNRAFNVRGSLGSLWRLSDLRSRYMEHRAVVREDRYGVSVWPIGLGIGADRLLALMLYLQSDERLVFASGCREIGMTGPREVYGDYGGMI